MDDIVIRPLSDTAMYGMMFTLGVSFILPIALAIYGKVKLGARLSSFFFGLGTFIVFAMTLEGICHSLVMKYVYDFTQNIWVYAIYGGIMAGLFEEGGRYLCMRYVMRGTLDSENALMFGVGHGGAEMMIAGGFGAVSNLVLANVMNSGQLGTLVNQLEPEMKDTFMTQLAALTAQDGSVFFMAGVERISALAIQIALSYIVYLAVRKGGDMKYFVIAILIHALIDMSSVLMASYLPVYAMEGILIAIAAALGFYTYKLYQANKTEVVTSGGNNVY